MIDLVRVPQLVGHCGPSSVAMLLGFQGVSTTQEEIVKVAGISQTVEEIGSRIDQLAYAIEKIEPSLTIMGKFNCTSIDIDLVINSLKLPFGVEWQGIFEDKELGQFEIGHYSVLNSFDPNTQNIGIVDPDDTSIYKDGIIPKEVFFPRWWEVNIMKDEKKYRTDGLGFVIVGQELVEILQKYGFSPVNYEFLMASSSSP